MKIIVVNGSPHGASGNTHRMVEEFLAGAQEAGAETENVFLVEKTIKHCRGCMACWIKTPGVCVIEDDMRQLIEKVVASDVLVFASPVYIDNVTGLMKNFMDRLLPVIDPHFEKDEGGECKHPLRYGGPRKRIVVISNSGFPEQSHFQVLRLLFRRITRNFGGELVGEIYRGGGEIFRSKNVFVGVLLSRYKKLLREAGKELVVNGRISDTTGQELEKPLVSDEQYVQVANQHWDKVLG